MKVSLLDKFGIKFINYVLLLLLHIGDLFFAIQLIRQVQSYIHYNKTFKKFKDLIICCTVNAIALIGCSAVEPATTRLIKSISRSWL